MKKHHHTEATSLSKPKLGMAVGLTSVTLLVEVLTGWWTNSIALLSDAGHVFMDLSALVFSLVALQLSGRPASSRRTFGLHRMEVFAAFLNGALVTAVAVWIVIEAVGRLGTQPPVKTGPLLVVAVAGLLVNLIVAWNLHEFARRDINIRGAFLHVIGDALASLGVVVGAILIRVTGAVIIDPIVALMVAGIIVVNAIRILKESLHILMEGVPNHIRLEDVVAAISGVPGVGAVEDTHVWTICSHICSLSAHVTVEESKMPEQEAVVKGIHKALWDRFRIAHSTIEIQSSSWRRQPADSAKT